MELTGKSVLITGADGFIGSHLTEMLVEEGADVRALCLYNSFNSWGWLDTSPKKDDIDIWTGDVRDPHFCKAMTKDIEVVFHLAALIAIPYSYIAPDSYVDTNIKGTLNICQAARENGCAKVIHTSTSEVYGTALYVPIDEKHPLQPQSPYSASKMGADHMAMSFYNAFKLPVVIARPFNTYGPRQSARAVIPTIIAQIAAGRREIKVGDLSPTRDFNYVLDTCSGFIALAKSDNVIGKVINIGSNYEISIKDTFNLIKKIMDATVEFVVDPERIRPETSEVHRLWCDNTEITRLTGFVTQYDINKGISLTVDWFTKEDNLKHYKPGIYNI
jgi:NAD dependent epimerase/dehydratase